MGRGAPPRGVGAAMAVAAVTFLVASLVHSGMMDGLGMHDRFDGATVPELVIGVVLLAGSVPVLARSRRARPFAAIAAGFAIVGTIVGLNFTLPTGRAGDIAYHVAILTFLVVIAGWLALSGRRSAS